MYIANSQSGRALVTGGTSGLGLALVKNLLGKGWNVVATGRQDSNIGDHNGRYQFMRVDFASLSEVSATASEIASRHSFDLIVNNAGILSPTGFTETRDGLEYTFQVNFLAHLLLDEIIISSSNSGRLRIISVTSPVYRLAGIDGEIMLQPHNYSPVKAYPASKLYLALLHEILKRRHVMQDTECFSFDPGTFSSGIYRMQAGWFRQMYRIAAPFMRSPVRVAESLTRLIYTEDVRPGTICDRKGKFRPPPELPDHVKDSFTITCYNMLGNWI